MKGLANLGRKSKFIGMVGQDGVGEAYRRKLAAQHVEPLLLESGEGGSAQALCLVDGTGQRTMRTYLGASLKMGASDFPGVRRWK